MKICATLVGLTFSLLAFASAAQDTPKPMSAATIPKPCVVGKDCANYGHVLSFPAGALSYGPAAAFLPQPRGVSWLARGGAMTMTIHRPKDFPSGGKIRITLFHQVTNDAAGTIKFSVTPLGFASGNSFETYGSQSTNTIAAPENPTMLRQQSLVLAPGNGWNPDNDWWYLELSRQGSYEGSLRVMSVAIEY